MYFQLLIQMDMILNKLLMQANAFEEGRFQRSSFNHSIQTREWLYKFFYQHEFPNYNFYVLLIDKHSINASNHLTEKVDSQLITPYSVDFSAFVRVWCFGQNWNWGIKSLNHPFQAGKILLLLVLFRRLFEEQTANVEQSGKILIQVTNFLNPVCIKALSHKF